MGSPKTLEQEAEYVIGELVKSIVKNWGFTSDTEIFPHPSTSSEQVKQLVAYLLQQGFYAKADIYQLSSPARWRLTFYKVPNDFVESVLRPPPMVKSLPTFQKVVNLTGTPVVIYDQTGTMIKATISPEMENPTCVVKVETAAEVQGIPLQVSEITIQGNLPQPEEGVLIITFPAICLAHPERNDLGYPHGPVVNDRLELMGYLGILIN